MLLSLNWLRDFIDLEGLNTEEIVEKMEYEHDESQHGVSWRTKSLVIIHQEERYKIGTIIDWEYYVRDSY